MSLTPEQRQERTTGLGGSDALAYTGHDPRKTALELYLEKTGEAPVEEKTEARREWGSRLEPVVRDWVAEKLGRKITIPKQVIRSTEIPFLIAHLDGITESPMEGVEVKCADKFEAAEFGEPGTDQIPIRYALQVMHYMIVTRLRVFHLGALVGGNDARYYRIDYDPELAKLLVDHARKFWRCVESRTPPAPVSLTDVDLRWPRSLERSIVATDTIKSAVAELKSIREVEAEAAKKGDAIEVSLKAYMGEADALSDGKRMLATWKTQERERFAQKEFAKDHPELLQQYRTSSSFRVFRLK